MSRLGSFIEGVDRADVAEKVDQGIGSSPFTRWLKSKLTIDSDHSQDGRCVFAELPGLLQHLDPQHKVQMLRDNQRKSNFFPGEWMIGCRIDLRMSTV